MVKTEDVINDVLQIVESGKDLKNAMWVVLMRYKLEEKTTEISCKSTDNFEILKKFIATKKIEGKSDKTLKQYIRENNRFLC